MRVLRTSGSDRRAFVVAKRASEIECSIHDRIGSKPTTRDRRLSRDTTRWLLVDHRVSPPPEQGAFAGRALKEGARVSPSMPVWVSPRPRSQAAESAYRKTMRTAAQ